jgi:Mg-chelatase subunit ChlD
MVFFSTNVSRLEGNGGTSIASGLELALKTIRDRKVPNKVTSIFLLSDGLDSGADERFNKILKRPENSELGAYSIHSFGFGEDHD